MSKILVVRVFPCSKEENEKVRWKGNQVYINQLQGRNEGYKLWDLVTRKIAYSKYVIFREVRHTSKTIEALKEEEQEYLVFNLNNKESDSSD